MEHHTYAKSGSKKWSADEKRLLVEHRIASDEMFAKYSPKHIEPWRKFKAQFKISDYSENALRKQWFTMVQRYRVQKQNSKFPTPLDECAIDKLTEEWEFFKSIHAFMNQKTNDLHSYALKEPNVEHNVNLSIAGVYSRDDGQLSPHMLGVLNDHNFCERPSFGNGQGQRNVALDDAASQSSNDAASQKSCDNKELERWLANNDEEDDENKPYVCHNDLAELNVVLEPMEPKQETESNDELLQANNNKPDINSFSSIKIGNVRSLCFTAVTHKKDLNRRAYSEPRSKTYTEARPEVHSVARSENCSRSHSDIGSEAPTQDTSPARHSNIGRRSETRSGRRSNSGSTRRSESGSGRRSHSGSGKRSAKRSYTGSGRRLRSGSTFTRRVNVFDSDSHSPRPKKFKRELSEKEKYYKHRRHFERRMEHRLTGMCTIFGRVLQHIMPDVDISPLAAMGADVINGYNSEGSDVQVLRCSDSDEQVDSE